MKEQSLMSPRVLGFPESAAIAACVLALVYYFWTLKTRQASFLAIPFIALSDDANGSTDKARMQWLADYRAIIQKGLSTVRGVFRVETGDGPRIVVPSAFADELRNNPDLNFADTATDGAFGHLPGFQPAAMLLKNNIMQDTIKMKLTRSLDSITPDLKAETAKTLQVLLGEKDEWQEISLKYLTYRLIARISSSLFFGPEVADSEEWLNIAVPYTMDIFNAARVLRTYPPIVRSIVHWFIPECRRVRRARKYTREIIVPKIQDYLKERSATKGDSSKAGCMIPWVLENARSKDTQVNMEDIMLNLTIAAIHSTNEMLSYLMLDLVDHPDAIEKLRKEAIDVLGNGGWKKTTLSQMYLLDAVMKESQRLHPISRIMMERRIRAPVTLSSGFKLPQGSDMFCDTERHFSSDIYPHPDEFIPERFLEMRVAEDGKGSSKCNFVITSPEHMGFGHGLHACPGRFFVGNEIKIAVVYLLLKYDWKLSKEGRIPEGRGGHSTWVPMEQKIMFKRRTLDLSIDL